MGPGPEDQSYASMAPLRRAAFPLGSLSLHRLVFSNPDLVRANGVRQMRGLSARAVKHMKMLSFFREMVCAGRK